MWLRSAFLFILLSEFAESFISDNYCRLTPQRGFNPKFLTGRWYGIKILYPSYFRGAPVTDPYWQISFEPKTGIINIEIKGRTIDYPYGCANIPVTLTPSIRPGFYKWRAPGLIPEADVVITDTDYKTYMVLHLWLPNMKKGCERIAIAYGRARYEGDKFLSKYLDKIIERKLCLDPTQFRFVAYSPLGLEDCTYNGKGWMHL